ncbi:MAG: hypothetical protein N2202_03100 [Proteobacteria bacterium]|nr:hypothetical protein [Pseudomonadota bacterium]
MNFNIADFIEFIKSILFKFPTNTEQLKENPLPPFIAIILLYLLLRRKFKKFLNVIFILFIFLFGYFYGIVHPLENETVSIAIFAFSSLISLVLLIFYFFVKDE